MQCKCGREVVRVELRVVQRCELGHYVSSEIAPSVMTTGLPEPASSGQLRAFHAKCTAIDRIRGDKIGTKKHAILMIRGMKSASELSGPSMTKLLDELETEVFELDPS